MCRRRPSIRLPLLLEEACGGLKFQKTRHTRHFRGGDFCGVVTGFFWFRVRLLVRQHFGSAASMWYILTGCHDCICYILLRRCFSFLIHCTSLVDFVSYCTSPFSLIYSFLTLCGCHFLGASPFMSDIVVRHVFALSFYCTSRNNT